MRLQSVRMIATCNACAQPVPIVRLFEAAACANCRQPVPVAFEDLDDLPPEQERHWTQTTAAGTAKADVELREVVCHGCKSPLPEPRPEQLASGAVACGCGEVLVARPLGPEHALRTRGAVTHLLGEDATSSLARVGHAPSTRTVTLHCSGCGAPLETRGETRSLKCSFCKMDSLIPDALWAELHPVRAAPWIHLWRDAAALAEAERERAAAVAKRRPSALNKAVRIVGLLVSITGFVLFFSLLFGNGHHAEYALVLAGAGLAVMIAATVVSEMD